MNIAVIGTGWLGHPLATKLTELGHIVYGSRRTVPEAERVVYRTFIHPSRNPINKEIIPLADVVILAFPPGKETPEQYAGDCLDICRLVGEQARVILISSTGVYRKQNGTCSEESFDDLQFDPDYPVSRAEFELIQLLGKRLTIVRLAGLIGPNRYPVKNMSASGKTYKGNEPVNVIHQQDAVDLVIFITERKISGEIVNGCAAEHPLREAYYSWMADKLGIDPPLFLQSTADDGKIISSAKSRELGFSYTYDNPFDFLS
jgi:nucleoside-diphosphate-sugar epimerase